MGADHIYLELTNRCNLSCRHCYLSAGPNGQAQLDAGALLRAFELFVGQGGVSVTLSGGEPLLHPEWHAIARRAVSLGLRTTLATNGTMLLESGALESVLDLGISVALSVDAATSTTHDSLRGRGSWADTMRSISALVEAGAGERIIVCFTPTDVNVNELWPLANLLASRGVSHLYLSVLEDRGRERAHRTALALSTDDRVNLLVQVALLFGHSAPLRLDAGHLKYFFERLWHGWDGFGDPIEGTLRVNPRGAVFLTAYSDDERFCLGDLSDLGSCWDSPKAQQILATAAARRNGVSKCRDCHYWLPCGGGSPIRAFATHGEIAAPDDFCYAKQVFLDRWFRAL